MVADSGSDVRSEDVTYAQQLYARIYSNPMVQQVMYGYDRTKHSCSLMERTLGGVESRVQDAANRAVPVYEHYCQPQVDAVYNVYNKGVENTKYAMEVTRSAAVTTSTLGIGAAVVAAQLSLALGAAGANLLLDCAISSKRIGGNVINSAMETEKAMEQRLLHFIQQAQGVAQVPLEKLSEQANGFLDIANAVVDRSLGLHSEADPAECSLGERVSRLVRRLSTALSNRAHDDVIDPMYAQMHTVMEQLSKSLILVDLIRERQAWAIEKVDELHASVNDLKARVEKEAQQLKQKPEEILMRTVRHSSAQLTDKLNALREKGNQVLGESANEKLDAATNYLGRLDQNLGDAEDIYKVRDEILTEARTKLSELAQWTSNWLVRDQSNENGSA